jgi:hypothetical protein
LKTYKFASLKNKAATQANQLMGGRFAENSQPAVIAAMLTSNLEANGLNWRDNYEALKALVIKQIDNWDVRCVKSLIEHFPNIVNKAHALPEAQCNIEVGDNAKWIVTFH